MGTGEQSLGKELLYWHNQWEGHWEEVGTGEQSLGKGLLYWHNQGEGHSVEVGSGEWSHSMLVASHSAPSCAALSVLQRNKVQLMVKYLQYMVKYNPSLETLYVHNS